MPWHCLSSESKPPCSVCSGLSLLALQELLLSALGLPHLTPEHLEAIAAASKAVASKLLGQMPFAEALSCIKAEVMPPSALPTSPIPLLLPKLLQKRTSSGSGTKYKHLRSSVHQLPCYWKAKQPSYLDLLRACCALCAAVTTLPCCDV